MIEIASRYAPQLVFLGAVGLLGGAFAFEHLGGMQPCVLCLWQRWPHAITIGLAGAGLLLIALGQRTTAVITLGASALVLWAGAGIAAFHVGVEQGWWEGLPGCTAGAGFDPNLSIDQMREALFETSFVPCDQVAWSMLGISMAGWNAIVSIGLGALALLGARALVANRAVAA